MVSTEYPSTPPFTQKQISDNNFGSFQWLFMVPLWSLGFQHSLKIERRFFQLLSFSQGAEGNSCLYCWEQEPSTLIRYLSSTLTPRQTLPPSPSSEANMGKNSYLPPSLLPLPHSSGFSLFLVSEKYVKFFCTLSYFTHTPPASISV
jgi:hypothetical protein